MARNDLMQMAIVLGGSYLLYRVALTGGGGAAAQKTAFDLCKSLKGESACCKEIASSVLPENQGKLCVGSTPTGTGGTPPPSGTCNTAFIPGKQYVAAVDGGFEVVINGQRVHFTLNQHEAEQVYNQLVCGR